MALGFNDRRPVQAVPKVELRSRAALEEHLRTHHNGFGARGDWEHSELRSAHQDFHGHGDYVQSVNHVHDRVNPPDSAR